ncbi:MAG: MscL family protein [Candidatus Nanohalobium sp.]
MSLTQDFVDFLQEYGVIGLAIAFVIGVAVKDLVSATVDVLIIPVVGVFLPAGEWQNAVLTLANIEFQIGLLLSALIDFLIIAFLVFLFVRYVLGKTEVGKSE